MATTLEDVKNNLPPDAVGEGWDDVKITGLVETGDSLARIMMTYWSGRAAAYSKFVTVSESGSTRSLSDVHKQALDMLKYWTDRANREEGIVDDPRLRSIRFGRMKRV
jgi:hypothetical protein